MKLIKFGILVNKTTYQNPSMRDSSISGPGVRESFGNSREEELRGVNFGKSIGGGGHTANPFHVGGMEFFWNHTM